MTHKQKRGYSKNWEWKSCLWQKWRTTWSKKGEKIVYTIRVYNEGNQDIVGKQ